MSSRTAAAPPPGGSDGRIVDVDVTTEMQGSFLEYAYSVIHSRALPDARDGLKPVQRRILFQMDEMGLRPDRSHVKSGRIVGDVMGKLHPHGDGAIYDALARLAQPFTMRVPLIDGHGNFGSLDAGPAAYRYTEARQAPTALLMTDGLDEDVVDFVPTYDNASTQPGVLPAAYPNLLVNGSSGIAVGMATNIPPHNLVEVIGAARHLIAHPNASLDDLMRFVPGPDFPLGGKIIGLDGIREAYATGRGSFRTRASTRVENVTPRRRAIVVTELPYLIGPEKVIARISEAVATKKLVGIAAVADLSDLANGMRLVIEVKSGFQPEAVLEQLFRQTPMEETFGVNCVALVEGQPRTLGLRDMLQVFIDHRLEVVRRRTAHRLARRQERLHLVDGLLLALVDLDEVIQVIRTSDDAESARVRLMDVFDLSEPQANYILELRLRRLTRLSRLELEGEADDLRREIDELATLLADPAVLRTTVSTELAEVARSYGNARRTVLLESSGVAATTAATPLEVADDPCLVLLSTSGLLARVAGTELTPGPGRAAHDAIRSVAPATVRGDLAVVTSRGRMIRVGVLDLPSIPVTAGALSLSGGAPLTEFVNVEPGERVVALAPLGTDIPGLALGTAEGIVKRVVPDYPANRDAWEVIALRPGDEVVGAVTAASPDADLVFITTDAQLLRFDAGSVRPQGRAAGGMAGVRLTGSARAIFFGSVVAGPGDPDADDPVVVTIAGSSAALPGTEPGTAKVTPYAEYPAKGRGTGGVRCHRFLRGEDTLLVAWAGRGPAKAAAAAGTPVELPQATGRRDGSGTALVQPVAAVAGVVTPILDWHGVTPHQ